MSLTGPEVTAISLAKGIIIVDPTVSAGTEADPIDIYFVKSFKQKLHLSGRTIPGGLTVGSNYCPDMRNIKCMLFQFDGGTAPYPWQNIGILPPGLIAAPVARGPNPNSILAIEGAPQQGGVGNDFKYTVRVTDSSQPPQIVSVEITFPFSLPPASTTPTYLYNKIANAGCFVGGFATKIGIRTIFVDDRTQEIGKLIHTLAHEIEHSLGLNHPRERPDYPQPQPPNDTCLPLLSQTDSDYLDPTQLMWWTTLDGQDQSHIGVHQWWQLNRFEASACR